MCISSYRFCLVMIQEYNPDSDITVGCSNITQLQISQPDNIPNARLFRRRPFADLSKLDRSVETKIQSNSAFGVNIGRKFNPRPSHQEDDTDAYSQNSYDFVNSLHKSFLPGIGLGIFVTSLLVLIWGALRLRHKSITDNHNGDNDRISRRSSTPNATTCYAASEQIARLADSENRTRYLKLQATTSL